MTADSEGLLDIYSGYKRATSLFTDQLSTEDKQSWREHAPSKPHLSVEDDR